MTTACKKDIESCNTLNEIFAVVNRHYDLDMPLGMIKGFMVKKNVIDNFDNIISKLGIPERSAQRKRFL